MVGRYKSEFGLERAGAAEIRWPIINVAGLELFLHAARAVPLGRLAIQRAASALGSSHPRGGMQHRPVPPNARLPCHMSSPSVSQALYTSELPHPIIKTYAEQLDYDHDVMLQYRIAAHSLFANGSLVQALHNHTSPQLHTRTTALLGTLTLTTSP